MVLDIEMGGLSGWGVLDAVPAGSRRVIVLTGLELDGPERARLGARGATLLAKGGDAVRRVVDALLAGEEGRDESR